VLVAEDLHLDVAGALDHLFEIALAIAEGGLGLAPALAHLFLKLVGADRPHAAPAAAPGGLEHQGIADLLGLRRWPMSSPSTSVAGITGTPASMATRRALALSPSARMVSAFGPMKAMPASRAGIHEIGVFRQQAVARVDRVGAAHLGDADDLVDRQIGRDRAQPLADLVGLVGLEPVQASLSSSA
jgi:hypothetical protein